MAGSLLFAMTDYYPGQPVSFSPEMLAVPFIKLALALGLSVAAIALLARFLPNLPLFHRLVLGFQSPVGPSIALPTALLHEARVKIGDEGVARTILRPAGKATFGDALVDVVADGEFIDPGSRVRVRGVEGERVIVDRV
jgi:membrane-bound serine protease (ClpP class)